ncbi:MAG TPA: type II toxin-antitoxin system VapC family toxin [Thermoanaerobaculia bacterium]|jgi:predicted nucleic acid-binding protein|nr:type II toxin-antitoxin system VapC family toxin [Thermoanaerobaculia bacterium]
MNRCVVLDAGALTALASNRSEQRSLEVRAALRAATRLRREVIVPAVILAELYRGPRHNSVVDACLSRETGIRVRDTDRALARIVGGVLAAANLGSMHLADAHVIAVAVDSGGGLVLTTDPDDLGQLAATFGNVTAVQLS